MPLLDPEVLRRMWDIGGWLVPGTAATVLFGLVLLVMAVKGIRRLERPVRRWWWRRDWSREFTVVMGLWAQLLFGSVVVPALVFYALIVVLFFGGLSYVVGQHSVAQYRKNQFQEFPEIETAGPPHGAGVTRLFECRGDFCLLIRTGRAIVVPRNQLEGRTILGRSVR